MAALTKQQLNVLSQASDVAAQFRDLMGWTQMVAGQVQAIGTATFVAADYSDPKALGDLAHLDAEKVAQVFAAFNAIAACCAAPAPGGGTGDRPVLAAILRAVR